MTTRNVIIAASLLVAALVLATGGTAHAQSATSGAIQGVVTDAGTKEPLAGVTVIATSPALQGTQTTFTDESGSYKITNLPPGTYQVTFYYAEITVRRTDVPVSINKTTPAFVGIDTNQAGGEVIEIEARPPAIDPNSTTQGITVDQTYTRNLPVAGRSFESVLDAAPGASSQPQGAAFSGSSALENQYVVDGLNTTELVTGSVGSSVVNEFIEEIEILTGGYNAEYGRSTGAVVNVATKSGSNEFHGSIFGYAAPGALVASADSAPAQTSSIDGVYNLAYETDFGFEIGGPIIKDRLWFYAGLAPQLARQDVDRITKSRVDCHRLEDNGSLSPCLPEYADGLPDIDPATGFIIYEEIDRSRIAANSSAYPFVGKLNFAASPEHQGQIGIIGNTSHTEDIGVAGAPGATRIDQRALSTDLSAKWTSKFNDNKTELEAVAGWHHSSVQRGSLFASADALPRQNLYYGNLGTWGVLGGESMKTIGACTDGGPDDRFPGIVNCPDEGSGYSIGGIGDLIDDKQDRFAGRLSATQRFRLLGNHEVKGGLDLEDQRLTSLRGRSGDAQYDVFLGDRTEVNRWITLPGDENTPGFDDGCINSEDGSEIPCQFASNTNVVGETVNWAAYLRDSWQVQPNLTINVGLRYEEQRMRYAEAVQDRINPLTGKAFGKNALVLDNMWAPRIGVIYDWTREGRSKVYAHYGRFYESVPLALNRINLGGESFYHQVFANTQCGSEVPGVGGPDGPSCLAAGEAANSSEVGGSGILVAPGTKAQYMDEAALGVEYELMQDLKVGISAQRRWLGRVLEDVSPDGTQTYVLANPGEFDTDEESRLEAQIEATDDADEKAQLEHLLDVYRDIRKFDTPTRTYDAVTLTASKQFDKKLFLQGSYTYSRATGNFPGIYSPDVEFIAPNISGQYDLYELVANRDGKAPQDHPHSFKVDSFYSFDFGKAGNLTTGGRFHAASGTPIDALAASAVYGQGESFVLPRGIMGRTDFEAGLDLHVAYGRKLGRGMSFEVFADGFNVFNRQSSVDADETYTLDAVNPIVGGSYEDLVFAKALDPGGTESSHSPTVNRNFRNAEARSEPLTVRLGARLEF